MRYEDARQQMLSGLRVARSSWRRHEYVYLAGKIVTHRCPAGRLETYLPTEADKQATDWELLR